ncbi:hypothetical protein CLUG_02796 [Clavispora lusitaniae ATCC 42720]|uniref:C3H1-type domain-containing protein n=1 Tax=Clavispora lusitaniae (strain ATCC 42720) TaxID=306902 RepID=C4Y2N3_CLAL4|nr:uncharacterized protein CLUG_02796 [Clavispora lusitaniae ATCC 42720]EEQ38670.1 hypothetical protein CLUG_02796 [Clavispora lusitaniae ATCC 42720]
MPPKKKQQDAKPKSKAHEDKGFGMKNKNKSKKVQQQINQMKQGVDGGAAKKREAEQKRKAEEKKAAEQAKKEAAALFGIVQPKVPFGVDPKSILCEFFKKGVCTKGNKCKFSHNPEVGRKDVKKDLYTDARAEKEADTMDNWDEEKLRKVILSKHGNPKTTTDKICKYFIEAVENDKYGWFWVCPNGGNECMYKHALPPGFVLKTKEQKRLERLAKDSEPQITLEEFIEMERGKLDRSKFTPITLETFKEWKKKQRARKDEEKKKENAKRPLTGREIMLKKFADKFYSEEDGDQGDEMDLSEFRSALPNGDEEFKDYGDGSDYDFDEEKKENGEKKDTEKDVVEEKKNVDVEEKENVDVAQVEA